METKNSIFISKPFGNGHLQIVVESSENGTIPTGHIVEEIVEEEIVEEVNVEDVEEEEEEKLDVGRVEEYNAGVENSNNCKSEAVNFSINENQYGQVIIQEKKFVSLNKNRGIPFDETPGLKFQEGTSYRIIKKISDNKEKPRYITIPKANIQTPTNCSYVETVGHVVGNIFGTNYPPEDNEARGRMEEVMKAAESLFSKRTRVLYHWMYPNSPKSKLKNIISTSWQNMGMAEKEIYISQVMGRFGFCRSNLMVNPQLGGMKNSNSPTGNEGNPNFSTRELQNAISSIASDVPENSLKANFTQNAKRKRLGRPPGSKNKKKRTEDHLEVGGPSNQEFQDDPELSGELLQFALNLNNTIGMYK